MNQQIKLLNIVSVIGFFVLLILPQLAVLVPCLFLFLVMSILFSIFPPFPYHSVLETIRKNQ